MLRQNSEPLALSEASLLGLRPAMNTPVLSVDFLPVGPARAAIVVFAEEYGGIGLALGIRSNAGGQVAVFRNQEPIDEKAPLSDAVEPALAAAERMGFLFDDDMLSGIPGAQRRAEATALWGELMGDAETADASDADADADATLSDLTEPLLELDDPLNDADDLPELMLDEVAPVPAPVPVASKASKPVAAAPPASPQSVPSPVAAVADTANPVIPKSTLSRFRNTETSTADASGSDQGDSPSQLGRIPLVKVRRGRDGSKRVPFLARLLSSF
jgi:hypothetical protein